MRLFANELTRRTKPNPFDTACGDVGPNARWRYQEIVSNSLLGRTLSGRASATIFKSAMFRSPRSTPPT
jgi:hypothetical protein